jgi:penicillin-binding protein 1A
MRGALAYSVNTVSVKLIQRAGIINTISLARKLGISSNLEEDPSISLGSSAISMMEMAGAYSALATNGVSSYPYFIKSIEDRRGKVYDDFKPKVSGKQAISPETAQIVRHMLQSVIQEGTGSRLRWRYGVMNDVAGKTGTTQENADGWFMAVTPNMVIGTWVGADDPRISFRSTYLGQGSNTALPMAAYFLQQVNKDDSYQEISKAKFPSLPYRLRSRVNCDLYELNDDLLQSIEKTVWQRDSIMQADTLSKPPPETFLQLLYKRKMRIMLANQPSEETPSTPATAVGNTGGAALRNN